VTPIKKINENILSFKTTLTYTISLLTVSEKPSRSFQLPFSRSFSPLDSYPETMKYQDLLESVQSAAGLRLRLRLQPMYGEGELIFPSTVDKGAYLVSERRIPGYESAVDCAIIDSVQSQANRFEKALLDDIRAGNIEIPHVVTDFSGLSGLTKSVGEITCFDAPHRIFDAIIRDSVDSDGTHFPLTETGKAIISSNASNATAIFGVSPASLLFGSWDSTGISGGLGEKYTRCVVSELVGVNALTATRAGVRRDPLNASKDADPVKILKETKDEMWTELNRKTKFTKPSQLNHGNVPWGGDGGGVHGGVTVDYVRQSTTISFPALRQLRFPVAGKDTPATSASAQAVLAAMALHAVALNVEAGCHLRSRCDLIMDEKSSAWELLNAGNKEAIPLTAEQTRVILNEAIAGAKAAGLPWNDQPIRLSPSAALAKLVTVSQEQHAQSTELED